MRSGPCNHCGKSIDFETELCDKCEAALRYTEDEEEELSEDDSIEEDVYAAISYTNYVGASTE